MPGNIPSVVDKHNTLVVAFKHEPFIKVELISSWQKGVKWAFDFLTALSGLILLSPLLLYIAIRIKLDSRGAIFYFQERIGLEGKPFVIFKFRSMYENAEKDGPALSHANDKRVTKWGRIMRQWKLDELPQLLNVLLGDMSLVGPRPERKFYIDKVSTSFPYFGYLHQVKPGLTSLGMIKFGYARNIDQIIKRMKYDVSYIENYSLFLDLQILLYTLPTIVAGNSITRPIKFQRKFQRARLRPLN